LTGNLFDTKLGINRFPVLLAGVPMDLGGKVAIVTGSGRGLGRAYATALAAAGAAVVVNDVDAGPVAAVVAEIEAAEGRATGLTAPVGDTATAQALVDAAVREFGRLDVLITNAGILRDRVLWKMTDEDFDAVIHVHLRGTFTCARAAAVRMRAQGEGGRIILISSPAGQRGNFGQTNYAAAKAGIAAMARTWALELARSDITVNAVVPVAATEMTRTIPAFAPVIAEAERTGRPFPAWLRRNEGLGTVDDVTGLVTFLASDAAGDITGQAIGVGGDRLVFWAHPREKRVAFADGGWSADAIAAMPIREELETYGIPAPQAPDA
jgi:NAD(P)-dependent dehydrogenase (short-subunit alcohol dehydrogenase family)